MKKILIANRGEIAVRVIRACQELGIRTVAVHSTADRDSLHAKLADESICIGPPPSTKSYLSIPSIMSAAELSGVDGIHPGYGFLSENSEFAEICRQYRIKFIGPKPEHIRALGNKVEARAIALKAGVPMLPGSKGAVADLDAARRLVQEIGFPVIVKAAAGGGGRGMKICRSQADLDRFFGLAQVEAQAAFGSAEVFVERYCERPRHVEVQMCADSFGTVATLGERDCTVQRRHQKIIEEAPSPSVTPALRKKFCESAERLAKAVGYESVGTCEFLMEESGEFYFMEVNTRIQVEHPVTEQVTGIDLIKEQIKIACGDKLSFRPQDVVIRGHAIECRINAEDPQSFAPWPGKITAYHEPGGPGIRVDSMAYTGYVVPPNYDSMIAKLISFGADRDEALVRMERALGEMKVDGIRTNIPLHQRILRSPEFRTGNVSTRFLETFLAQPPAS